MGQTEMLRLPSVLEWTFETYLAQLAPELVGSYVTEYCFHPRRNWRFAIAWPEALVAVELVGGVWRVDGRWHARNTDREKLNVAVLLGWRVLRFSGEMLHADPVSCVAQVVALLAGAVVDQRR